MFSWPPRTWKWRPKETPESSRVSAFPPSLLFKYFYPLLLILNKLMDALNNKAAANKIKLRQTALLNKIDSSLKQQWQEQTTADVWWDRPSAEKASGQAMAIVWSLWFHPESCGFSPRSQFLITNHLSEHMQGQLLLSKPPSNLNIIHPKDLRLKHPAIDMAIQHSNVEAQMGWSRR